jgi:hypothetical protein
VCNLERQTEAKLSANYREGGSCEEQRRSSNELCLPRRRVVAEIKGYGPVRVPGKVPPSLILRSHILLSLFSSVYYGPLPKALMLACRL